MVCLNGMLRKSTIVQLFVSIRVEEKNIFKVLYKRAFISIVVCTLNCLNWRNFNISQWTFRSDLIYIFDSSCRNSLKKNYVCYDSNAARGILAPRTV